MTYQTVEEIIAERDALRAEFARLMEKHNALHVNAKALRTELQAAHKMSLNGVEWREEAEKLRAELDALRKEADKFGDGIDWVQRAMQAEAELDALKRQAPFHRDDRFQEAFEKTLKERGWNAERDGSGYRSGMAQHAWFIALGTANKLKLYLSPVPASVPDGVMRERVMEAIAEALGDGAYDCTRVWSAWGYGTMGSDDFRLIANDPARLDEIAEAAIQAVFAAAPKPEVK